MKMTGLAAALLALLTLIAPFAAAEAPASGLCFVENETAVYTDASMETLYGVLAPGQTVYAEEEDGEGVLRIVFVYPLLPKEGWIDSAAALPLEGQALEDYLYAAGEDGMRYKNLPLLPAVFAPANAEEAQEGPWAEPEAIPQVPAAAILRQPEDQRGRVGDKVTFTVGAENVVSYRCVLTFADGTVLFSDEARIIH